MRETSEAVALRPPPTTLSRLLPANMEEALALAEKLSKSDIVPKDFFNKPGNVLVAMLMGIELGLHPIQAVQSIAVINGRPSIWGDAGRALVEASGFLEWIKEEDDGNAATCTMKRKGRDPVTRTFSQADAERIKVWEKDRLIALADRPIWRSYGKRMRQWRAFWWCARDVFADVLKGVQGREETGDYDNEETTTGVRADPGALMPRKIGDPAPMTSPVASVPEAPVAPAQESVAPISEAEMFETWLGITSDTPPAPAGDKAAPAAPGVEGERQPLGGTVRFTIGKQTFETGGFSRQQMLWSFDLEERVEKKQKGLTKAILKSFGAEHRTDLTAEQGEQFLIRLSETLGIEPPWVTNARDRGDRG